MGIKVDKKADKIELRSRALSTEDFQFAQLIIKSIPGRRWNPDEKRWEFPANRMAAEKLVHLLNPEQSVEFQLWYKQVRAEAAREVITELPEDAELQNVDDEFWQQLRPYQRAAVRFMADRQKVICADDMGLGKTVESIATVYESEVAGPFLVIAPNKTRRKWAKEIKMWTGEQSVILDGKTPIQRKQQLEKAVERGQWVIVNWEKLRLMPELQKVKWGAVIADEAHRAKNRKAKQTKALWKIRAPVQLALTGTPIQNSPDEIWALLKWLYPKEYTSYWRFYNDYVDYYEGYWGKIITGVKNADALRFELSDKMIRRTKDEALDLPKLTIENFPVELGPKQRKLYAEAEKELWLEIKRAAAEGDKQAERMLEDPIYFLSNGAARTVRLRQICSSPALLGGEDDSAKLDTAVELVEDAARPVVVFSEFRKTCTLLVERLAKRGIKAESYMSGDPETVPERFQEGEFDVLVMTRDTGGEGIDLYRADTAIFIEQHWTPARNEQALSRLHRFGQENSVSIINLVGIDTIDDGKVQPTNKRKTEIVEAIL